MDVKAITRIEILVRMDKPEATDVLDNPSAFQSMLRQALAGARAEQAQVAVRRSTFPEPLPLADAPGAWRRQNGRGIGKSVCPKCYLLKDNRGFKKHVAACPGAVVKAGD